MKTLVFANYYLQHLAARGNCIGAGNSRLAMSGGVG